jgi:hypothetical protein
MMSRIFTIALFLGFSAGFSIAEAEQIETPSVCSTYCCYKCGCESLTGCTSPDRPKDPPAFSDQIQGVPTQPAFNPLKANGEKL